MNSDNEQPVTTTHAPKTITVARRMYLVPRDATIPGGTAYRHTGAFCAPDAEYITDLYGLAPNEREGDIDFYTYEKIESPEPPLVVQGGLVLGNVRFTHENPDDIRPIVMFLDGGKVAVVFSNGQAIVIPGMHWDDYDPGRNDMIFDVIFDPEHDTSTTFKENTKWID